MRFLDYVLILFVFSLLVLFPAPAGAGIEEHAKPEIGGLTVVGQATASTQAQSDLEETIVEVYLRRTQKLSGGIVAYIQGDDMLFPLQELMLLLELAIDETPQGAAGWFISEDRRFVLNLGAHEVVSAGQKFTISENSARRIDNQLFVSAQGLSQWLPLDFQADLRALQLQVNPREQTPMEERAARNKNKEYGAVKQYRSQLPKQETPYAFAQIPGIEVDGAIGHSSRSDIGFFSGGSARAFGDLLYMNGEFFITGSEHGVADARLHLGRFDPDGGLLGPLNATEFSIGDVGTTTLPLVSPGLAGRGIHVSSRPEGYISEFDRIVVEGSVPVGHDVELYRNNILMASSGPSTSGQYRFDNVPLLRGPNEIRLEFYGPQGQRRTEVKSYFVGDNQVPVGKINYDVTLQEVGRSVFGFANWARDNLLYENMQFGGAARFDYGLSRDLTVTGGLVAAPLPANLQKGRKDDYRTYATLGARTTVGELAVGLDTAVDDSGGVAAGLSAQALLAGWSLTGRHEQFLNGFVSDTAYGVSRALGAYDYRTSNSSIRADTTLSDLYPGLYMNLGLIGEHTTFESSDDSWRAGFSLGVSAGILSVSNELYYGGALFEGDEGLFGSLAANLRLWDGLNLRASADYDWRDQADVSGYAAGLTAVLPYEVSLGLGYTRHLDRYSVIQEYENYYATLQRRFDVAEVGLLAAYGTYGEKESSQFGFSSRGTQEDELRLALTVSFSTFTDPETYATAVSSDPIARQGAIRPRAYLDANQNNIRDPDEPLVENARVLYAGQREPYYTGGGNDKAPAAVGTGGWTDIVIDRTGLPDPALGPGNSGRAVLPRPGVVSNIDLPVVAKAGVEGKVRLKLGKDVRPLPNVTVQVLHRGNAGEEDTVVAEAHTEFDGAFSLAEIPVGTYVIRVEPEQARQIGAKKAVETPITLTPETGVRDDIELNIERS